MLSHGLFIASNPKWEWEWKNEHPPPPPWNMIGDEYGDDCLACLPGPVGRKVKQFPRTFIFWALTLQYLFCEATKKSVCLVWIGIGFCETVLMENKHDHLSSPLIDCEESHNFANPKVRVSCFAYLPWFCKVSLSPQWFCLSFLSVEFGNDNFLSKNRYGSVVLIFAHFMLGSWLFHAYFAYFCAYLPISDYGTYLLNC